MKFSSLACMFCAPLLLIGCLRAEPKTGEIEWGEECDGTQPGNACLSLTFSVRSSIREGSPESTIGTLHWAVYRGGDVGLFGPGDNEALYDGIEEAVDMSAEGAHYVVHLPNVPAQPYQVLAFVDRNGDGKSGDGEAVTFPSEAFDVRADQQTRVDVVFDFLR